MNLVIDFDPTDIARITDAANQIGLAPAELIKRLALEHLPPLSTNSHSDLDAKLRFWQQQDDVTLMPDIPTQTSFLSGLKKMH